MKTKKILLAFVVLPLSALASSCGKDVEPLNALMGDTWLYEERETFDGSTAVFREMLDFTSERCCKRTKTYKAGIHSQKWEYDLTYTFDGEWGVLTGVYYLNNDVRDYPMRYDSVKDDLTVWIGPYVNDPDTRSFVYHRK